MSIAIEPASTDQDWQQVISLLNHVYVSDGYSNPDHVDAFMRRESLEGSGTMLTARNTQRELLGAVLFLHADSLLGQVATPGEAEFRVLAVTAEARGAGVGEALVRACIGRARVRGATALVMWSQPSMHSAHRLYGRLGFERALDREVVDQRGFLRHVFSLSL